jgi:hypothetical protein
MAQTVYRIGVYACETPYLWRIIIVSWAEFILKCILNFVGFELMDRMAVSRKKAETKEDGALILSPTAANFVMGLVMLLVEGLVLFSMISSPVEGVIDILTRAAILLLIGALGLIMIVHSFSRVEVNDHGIRSYCKLGIFKDTEIPWSEISNVKYDSFSVGLKFISKNAKISLAMEYAGFEDLLSFLRQKFGDRFFGVSIDAVKTDLEGHKKTRWL